MNKTFCILQNRFIDKHIGGYEVQIFNICHALSIKGWSIHYICEGQNSPVKNIEFIKLYQIPLRYYFNFYNLSAFKILKSISPMIIYQRSRTGFSCGLTGIHFKRRYPETKLIFSFGSRDDLIPFFLTKSIWANKKLSVLKKILFSLDTIIKDYIFQFNILRADLLISQNIEQQNICRQIYHRDSIIIRSVHPPVNKEIIKVKPPIVCWIANARPVKQPELFLELIKSMKDMIDNKLVQFVIVFGRNINKYQFTDLMDELKKINAVQILGELTIDQANEIMERSSILVNTSSYEGFSNTFIQAWLRETPVVSLNSDPDDILQNYRIGYCSKSMDQLKKDVRSLIENDFERIQLGIRSRRYAEEHHNPYKISIQLDELFTSLLNTST